MKTATQPSAEIDTITRDAQLAALGGAIKPKALTEAKGRLPENFASPVDFTVRVRGTVSKGLGEPGSSGTQPATCDLFNRSQVSEVMRLLKITPGQLRTALRKASAKNGHATDHSRNEINSELLSVFAEVAKEVAATLPETSWSNNGRAATVRTDVHFEIL